MSQTRSTFMSLNQKKKDETKISGCDFVSSMWLWTWKLVTDITPISHVLSNVLLPLSLEVCCLLTLSHPRSLV